MKNVLYIYCSIPKGTSRAKTMPNSEKIKPVAIIELHLSEGSSQCVSQLLSQSLTRKFHLMFCFKFHSNLLKAFRVNLKAFLGLVLPNSSLSGKVRLVFSKLIFFHEPCSHLCGPYYTVLP